MSIALIILSGILLVGAFVIVAVNRASPQVVGAAVPAATALLAALGLVFAFNRPAPISRVFPIMLIVERDSLLPISVPNRPFPDTSLILAGMMQQRDSKTFEPPEGQDTNQFVRQLYDEFVQKMLVDDLAMKQFGTWRMRIERFVDFVQFIPTSDASTYASKILATDELERVLGRNRFARVHSGFGKWAVPPGTQVQIQLPARESARGEVGTIRLANPFCEVTIETVRSISLPGLGKYAPLVGASIGESQAGYWSLQFIARINATFTWYLIGHPDMAVYREWVNTIVEELSFSFDEESLWNRTRDNYMLRRHFAPEPRTLKCRLDPFVWPPLGMSPPASRN